MCLVMLLSMAIYTSVMLCLFPLTPTYFFFLSFNHLKAQWPWALGHDHHIPVHVQQGNDDRMGLVDTWRLNLFQQGLLSHADEGIEMLSRGETKG